MVGTTKLGLLTTWGELVEDVHMGDPTSLGADCVLSLSSSLYISDS